MQDVKFKLCIVIPCYNESVRFSRDKYEDFINKNSDIKFCFVNDGSTDGTKDLLTNLHQQFVHQVCVFHMVQNMGKGEAVRQGVNYVHKNFQPDYISYMDADLSTPLHEAKRLYDYISLKDQLMCVFGSRVSVFGSKIKRLNYRHYGGRIIATMIDMVLKLSIYDTQCGLKVFHSHLIHHVFNDPFLSRWLFDVEIFSRIKMLYSNADLYLVMQELPINEWNEQGGSKVTIKDLLKVPFALIRISQKYKRNKHVSLEISDQIEPVFDQISIKTHN